MADIVSMLHLKFFKICGLIPNDLKDKSLKISHIYNLVLGLCLLGYINGVIYSIYYPHFTGNVHALSSTTSTIIQVVDLIAVITLLVSRVTKASLLLEICSSFNRIHHILGETATRRCARRGLLAITVLVTLITLSVSYNFYVQYLLHHNSTLSYRLVALTARIIFALAMGLAFCLLDVLHCFWKSAVSLPSRSQNTLLIFEPFKLKALTDLHQELCRASQVAGKYLGPIFLSVFASFFASTTLSLYMSYRTLTVLLGNHEHMMQTKFYDGQGTSVAVVAPDVLTWNSQTLIVNVNTILFNIILIAIVTVSSELIMEQSRIAKALTYKMSLEQKLEPSQSLFSTMVSLMSNRIGVSFSACDFFQISYSTICSMTAAMLTYLVILIQFDAVMVNPKNFGGAISYGAGSDNPFLNLTPTTSLPKAVAFSYSALNF